ncbi:hypothetical protein FKM82_019649 [Ascaphus truei]
MNSKTLVQKCVATPPPPMLCLFLVMKMSAVPQKKRPKKKSTGPIQWPDRNQVMHYGTIFLVQQDYDMVNRSLKRLSLKDTRGLRRLDMRKVGRVCVNHKERITSHPF